MHSGPLLSVILPCYNPLPDWQKTITDKFAGIKKQIPEIELIIVNDGSFKNFNEDESTRFFSSLPEIKIVSYTGNRGKGHALREGVKLAQGQLIIYTDIDFPYTLESFMRIYSSLKNDNADVAIGIRNQNYYSHLPKSRVKISKLLRFFIKRFLRIPTDDTQCGLKGFNQKGKEIFLQTTIDRYLFDLEFIYLAARKNLIVQTSEVELRPEVLLSTMNWKILAQELGNFIKIVSRSKT